MKKPDNIFKKGKDATVKATKTGINFIDKNPITTLKVVGVLAGIYLIYRVTTAANDVVDGTESVIDRLQNGDPDVDAHVSGTGQGLDASKATITEAQAINFASQLLTAFNKGAPMYGTDTYLVDKVLSQLKNGDDFLMVYNAFGDKDYNGYGSPPTGWWNIIDSYEKHNLVYWLLEELDYHADSDRKTWLKAAKLAHSAGFAF